jgi:hypothetical protein
LYGTIGDPDETRDDDIAKVVAEQIVVIEGMLLEKQVAQAPVAPAVSAEPRQVPVRPASTK